MAGGGYKFVATMQVQLDQSSIRQVRDQVAGLNLPPNISMPANALGGPGQVTSPAPALKDAVSEAIAFERTMTGIAQISGDNRSQVAAVGAEITRLATGLGVSSRGLADAALKFRQAGLAAGELNDALTAVARADLSPVSG